MLVKRLFEERSFWFARFSKGSIGSNEQLHNAGDRRYTPTDTRTYEQFVDNSKLKIYLVSL
jgi:hypothetical protein